MTLESNGMTATVTGNNVSVDSATKSSATINVIGNNLKLWSSNNIVNIAADDTVTDILGSNETITVYSDSSGSRINLTGTNNTVVVYGDSSFITSTSATNKVIKAGGMGLRMEGVFADGLHLGSDKPEQPPTPPNEQPSCIGGSFVSEPTVTIVDGRPVVTMTGRWVKDPIIFNLRGEKVQTTALNESETYFDMQNNGQRVKTGWATVGEGVLVYNPDDPNGLVTQDSQLVAGFDVLKALDSNRNTRFDAGDIAFNDMRVWVAADNTGVSRIGDLHSLAELGIASIDLNIRPINLGNQGNTILATSNFTWDDGRAGEVAAVDLAFNPYQISPPRDQAIPLVGTPMQHWAI